MTKLIHYRGDKKGVVWHEQTISADQSLHELDETLAAKLIQLRSRNSTPQLQIALIESGKSKASGFEVDILRRVTTIHPALEDGRQVRRMRAYDFQWNDTYGWFCWERRGERGGDTIWIWSETLGEVVIR